MRILFIARRSQVLGLQKRPKNNKMRPECGYFKCLESLLKKNYTFHIKIYTDS
jgi:hypothetical protein